VLVCAPQFAWAHFELGRALLDLDEPSAGARSFASAAELAEDPGLRAHFVAWQARGSEGERRQALAAKVLELDPGFVGAQEAGLREALENGDPQARDLLALGLAVAPNHLGLLSLRGAVEAMPQAEEDEGPDEFDLPDEVDRELARERELEQPLEAPMPQRGKPKPQGKKPQAKKPQAKKKSKGRGRR
jgi:hypothetical protein